MKTLAKNIINALAALGLAGVVITPALAGAPQPMTIKVDTRDIDLATAQGQKTLDQRVERAARAVCRTTSVSIGSRIMSQDAQACLAKARAQAREQVAIVKADRQRGG